MKSQSAGREQAPCCRRITLNGQEQLILETAAGQRITLQDRSATILVEDGNSVRLDNAGITLNAAVKITLNAALLKVSASEISFNTAIATFSGVVQADSIVANQITPGSGNVW